MESSALTSPQFTTASTPLRFQTPSLKLQRNTVTFKSPAKYSIRTSIVSGDDSVTLFDYGAGNVQSIRNAIRYLGLDIKDVQTPVDILNAKRLIFPGVGAFAAMMDVINQNGMADALYTYIEKDRPFGAYELAKAVEKLGAGEILLNCIDCDGQGKGFDIDLIKLISDAVSIPVIASSGAGTVGHFSEVFSKTNASAALAAGIFHRKEVPIQSVKDHLLKEGIEVRM